MKRKGGILLHPSSLNGKYGIGTLGSEAFEFIDLLKKSGLKIWQILPLNPTSEGDSPYQCFSAFAGNKFLISLDSLVECDLLSKVDALELEKYIIETSEVDFNRARKISDKFLKIAFNNFKSSSEFLTEFVEFCSNESRWLKQYAYFMSVKEFLNNQSLQNWPDKYKNSDISDLENDISFKQNAEYEMFVQYIFYLQWFKLKQYANQNGIRIIGDVPIYVSADSADVWSQPELFDLDEELNPINVAGVPPDYFSENGQLWGNPVFNWAEHQKSSFDWWKMRIEHNLRMFDMIRIDHFRGFASYWSIPANEVNAVNGQWIEAPGEELFDELKFSFGDLPIIAEDLGILTDDVEHLLEKCDFPGMKVLQFAFCGDNNNSHLPHNYNKNCVVFTATHDNNTSLGWYLNDLDEAAQEIVNEYLNCKSESFVESFIRASWSSVANMAIVPAQDFLKLEQEARMNVPGTIQDNWKWKITSKQIKDFPIDFIQKLNRLYNR